MAAPTTTCAIVLPATMSSCSTVRSWPTPTAFRPTTCCAWAISARPFQPSLRADIGNVNLAESRALGTWLTPLFVRALASGGCLVGDQPMEDTALEPITLASIGGADLPADTYFLYRKRA